MQQIAERFAAVGARCFLHAREIGAAGGEPLTSELPEIGLDPDQPASAASVITAGPPQACAFVRDAMGRRENIQRLASGFDATITVAGKTGTIPFVRNEAGVVTYPDGRRYAVAAIARL